MKLSVIVPVYNMAQDDKLTWCMDSLISQTVFVKDEDTMEIIESMHQVSLSSCAIL